MNLLALIKASGRMLHWRELRATVAYCPICEARRIFVRLKDDEISARCTACRASAVSQSIISVLRKVAPDLRAMDAYELSSRGPVHRYLRARVRALTASEFFRDVALGAFRNAVQCQDVQRLTYADASFDLCTSTEVFEHVPEDAKAFREMFRVLREPGLLIFTVPLHDGDETIERAVLTPTGSIEHLLEPQYHGDPLTSNRILAFRSYGRDVTQRLRSAGFAEARIVLPDDRIPWGFARPVVVAFKRASRQVSAVCGDPDTRPGTRCAAASSSR